VRGSEDELVSGMMVVVVLSWVVGSLCSGLLRCCGIVCNVVEFVLGDAFCVHRRAGLLSLRRCCDARCDCCIVVV